MTESKNFITVMFAVHIPGFWLFEVLIQQVVKNERENCPV